MPKRLQPSSPRLFTVDAANKTLPLVRAIVSDLAPLEQAVKSAGRRIEHLLENRDFQQGNPYSDELAAMQERLETDSQRVDEYVEELRQLGIEFKGPGGHVVFPTMLDGRLAYLSWQLGEEEVTHWLDFDASFEQRHSLLESTVAGDDA